MVNSAAILGASLEALVSARELADKGVRVCLVTESDYIGEYAGPPDEFTWEPMMQLILACARHPLITVRTRTRLTALERRGDIFALALAQEPGFTVDEKCNACGSCISACPVAREGRRPIAFPRLQGVPARIHIDKRGAPPCRAACPAGVNAEGYLALIRKGKFREALELERRDNPFAAVCGRVCTHPCEEHCTRKEAGGALAIRHLKRFIADRYLEEEGDLGASTPRERSGFKAAVVGAGPAGLACARELALEGHAVTVFDACDMPGGMLRYGIPAFRLPKEILDKEIDYIRSSGFTIETGKALGREFTLDDLFRDGFSTVFLATGAWQGIKLDFLDESSQGTMDALEFMERANTGKELPTGKNLLVIGGGNSALDAARAARRLGAKSVTIVYRRTRREMPAAQREVEDALREGIRLEQLASPVAVARKAGRLKSLTCLRNSLGEPDASGRRRPIPIEGSEFTLPADFVIGAIGQRVEAGLLEGEGLAVSRGGLAVVDTRTLATSRDGVFAGGDMVSGPATVIEAVAAGRRAAYFMHRRMAGLPLEGEWLPQSTVVDEEELERLKESAPLLERIPHGMKSAKAALSGFDEVEQGYTEDEARREAERCLDCGFCSECLECERACAEMGALRHDRAPREETIDAGVLIAAGPGEKEKLSSLLRTPASQEFLFKLAHGDFSPLESPVDGVLSLAGRPLPHEIEHLRRFDGEGLCAPDERRRIIAVAGSAIASSILCEERLMRHEWDRAAIAVAPAPAAGRAGVILCSCGANLAGRLEPLASFAGRLPGVAHSAAVSFLCSDGELERLAGAVKEHRIDRLVIGACACCSVHQICEGCSYQRVRMKKRFFSRLPLGPEAVEMINIREQWGLVHRDDSPEVVEKARDMVSLALSRAMKATRLEALQLPMVPKVLIVGADIAGVEAALLLQSLGYQVHLLEGSSRLEARFAGLDEKFQQKLARLRGSKVKTSAGARLVEIGGSPGKYEVTWEESGSRDGAARTVRSEVGAILWDESPPAADGEPLPRGESADRELFDRLFASPHACFTWGIFRARTSRELGSPYNILQGQYLAGRIDGFLSRRELVSHPGRFTADPEYCRACGRCVDICPHGVAKHVEEPHGRRSASIPGVLCKACGVCAPECPTVSIASGFAFS